MTAGLVELGAWTWTHTLERDRRYLGENTGL